MTVPHDQSKDLQELTTYSERNINNLREYAGEKALSRVPGLVKKFTANAPLQIFHETAPENMDTITASGFIYSYAALEKLKLSKKEGMTYAAKMEDDIFKNIQHAADAYLDFVYTRPHFLHAAEPKNSGIYLEGQQLRPDLWMSFRDGNQFSEGDKYALETGMTVNLGFSTYDVFVGEHIPEALALKALEYMANAKYVRDVRGFIYKKQEQVYASDPGAYLPPDPEDNMTFEQALNKHILEISSSSYKEECAGEYYKWSWREELDQAGLAYRSHAPHLDKDILDHPDFEKWFKQTLDAVCSDLAKEGQLAVPNKIDVKDAFAIRSGQKTKLSDPQKPVPAPVRKKPDFKP